MARTQVIQPYCDDVTIRSIVNEYFDEKGKPNPGEAIEVYIYTNLRRNHFSVREKDGAVLEDGRPATRESLTFCVKRGIEIYLEDLAMREDDDEPTR